MLARAVFTSCGRFWRHGSSPCRLGWRVPRPGQGRGMARGCIELSPGQRHPTHVSGCSARGGCAAVTRTRGADRACGFVWSFPDGTPCRWPARIVCVSGGCVRRSAGWRGAHAGEGTRYEPPLAEGAGRAVVHTRVAARSAAPGTSRCRRRPCIARHRTSCGLLAVWAALVRCRGRRRTAGRGRRPF